MSPISAEQKAEILAELAANRARQAALTAKQRFEAGEFSIELVRVAGRAMTKANSRLTLWT
jgi:hypothetical protein